MTPSRVGLLLDRDGTINTEVDFLRSPDELRLLPRAARAIREARAAGFRVAVFTNQSGIARGYLSEGDLRLVHDRLRALLKAEGASLDAIYYCPHHPTAGLPPFNIECACRKPKDGMLRMAAAELGIDLKASFVVGDRCVDMEAGRSAGSHTVLVRTGYGATEQQDCAERHSFDHVAEDLFDAWTYIRQRSSGPLSKP